MRSCKSCRVQGRFVKVRGKKKKKDHIDYDLKDKSLSTLQMNRPDAWP